MTRQPRATVLELLELEDYLLLSAVCLLPWAFGGVEMWAFRSAAFLMVSSACVTFGKRGLAGLGLSGEARWLLPAFLLGAWAALQMVPLPASVLRTVGPTAHQLYSQALPGYADPSARGLEALEARALSRVPEADAPAPDEGTEGTLAVAPAPCLSSSFRPLSLAPYETGEQLFWYFALLAAFLVARQRAADPERHRIYRGALYTLFASLAAVAFLQAATWNGKVMWVRTLHAQADPVGPYINPNHFAGVMELAVPALVGAALSRFRRFGREALYQAGFGGAIVGAGLCLAGGVFSGSKIAAVLLGGSLLGMGSVVGSSWRSKLVVPLALVVLLGGAAAWFVGGALSEDTASFLSRVDPQLPLEGRLVIWRSATGMFRDFALTGCGFGAFREVYPLYMPQGSARRWAQAHNDYLEVALDGGLVAVALLLWLGWGYLRRAARGLRPDGRKISAVQLGLAVGVLALSMHAFFDFNHQIPANALMFVVACALVAPAEEKRAA